MSTVIDTLPAGQSVVVYYTGTNLARAKRAAAKTKHPDPQLAAASKAWSEALAGLVDLLQKRLPDGQIAYLKVPRRVVDRTPVEAMRAEPSLMKRMKQAA